MKTKGCERHYVYLIARQDEGNLVGPVKVGITKSLNSRLATLQTGSAYPLQLMCFFRFPVRGLAQGIEKCFHVLMAEDRLSGEWFSTDPHRALVELAGIVAEACQYCADNAGQPDAASEIADSVGLLTVFEFMRMHDAEGFSSGSTSMN